MGNTCEAISTHTALFKDGDGGRTFKWSVNGGAYIKSGASGATVTVGSDGSVFTPFTLTCTVTDSTGNSVYSKSFIHKRINTLSSAVHKDTFYIMNDPLTTANKTLDFMVNAPPDDGAFKDRHEVVKTPTALEYPKDCTAILVNGDYIEVPYEFPADEEWMFIRCYDIDGRNFKIMVIVYHADNTADFLYGDQDTPPVLQQANVNLTYTPMTGNYRITGGVDVPEKEVIYDMTESFEYEVIYNMTTQI